MFAGGWLIYVGLILILAAVLGAVSAFREAPDLLTALTQAAGIAGLGGGIGAVLLFVSAWRWRQVVTIYQRGVHHQKLVGERWIRFADLTCAHHETTSYKGSAREHVRFCLKSGKKVVISDVTDARMLAGMADTAARSHGAAADHR